MNHPVLQLIMMASIIAAALFYLTGGMGPRGPSGASAPNGTLVRGLAPAASGALGRGLK